MMFAHNSFVLKNCNQPENSLTLTGFEPTPTCTAGEYFTIMINRLCDFILQVVEKSSVQADVISELKRLLTAEYRGASGIVYTTTIKEATDLTNLLRAQGCKVRWLRSSPVRHE